MPHPSQFCLDLKPYLSLPKLVHCYLGKSLTPDFTIMLSYFKFAFLGCTGPNSWVALTAATLKNAPQCTLKYCALEARKNHWQIVAFLRKRVESIYNDNVLLKTWLCVKRYAEDLLCSLRTDTWTLCQWHQLPRSSHHIVTTTCQFTCSWSV